MVLPALGLGQSMSYSALDSTRSRAFLCALRWEAVPTLPCDYPHTCSVRSYIAKQLFVVADSGRQPRATIARTVRVITRHS